MKKFDSKADDGIQQAGHPVSSIEKELFQEMKNVMISEVESESLSQSRRFFLRTLVSAVPGAAIILGASVSESEAQSTEWCAICDGSCKGCYSVYKPCSFCRYPKSA